MYIYIYIYKIMKYRVRGSLFIVDPPKELNIPLTSGIACSAIVEASSKKEAEEKGLKQLKKELGDYIKLVDVEKIDKNNNEFFYLD